MPLVKSNPISEEEVGFFPLSPITPSSSLTARCNCSGKMGISLGHGQRFMAQQFLQGPNVHSLRGQMTGVGMAQIVEPKITDASLSACRSEAVLNIPDVPPVPIPENIP